MRNVLSGRYTDGRILLKLNCGVAVVREIESPYIIWQMLSLTAVIRPRVLAVGRVSYVNTISEPTDSNICQIK
jgi:hypothetical protein